MASTLSDLNATDMFVDPLGHRYTPRPVKTFLIVTLIFLATLVFTGIISIVSGLVGNLPLIVISVGLLIGIVGVFVGVFGLALPVLLPASYVVGLLITSKFARYEIRHVFVGPFGIVRRANGLTFTLVASSRMASGSNISTVADGETDLRRRELIASSGYFIGPLLVLILSVVMVTPWLLIHLWFPINIGLFLAELVTLAFATVLSSFLIDLQMKSTRQWTRLLRQNDDVTAVLVEFLRLRTVHFFNRRPREWDSETISVVASQADHRAIPHAIRMSICVTGYRHDLDKGNLDRAWQHLSGGIALFDSLTHKERIVGFHTTPLTIFDEAAYFHGYHRRDAFTALTWLNRANEESFAERHIRLRAEAAVLFANGNLDAAKDRAKRALELLDQALEPGNAKAYEDWLRAMIRSVEAESHPAIPPGS